MNANIPQLYKQALDAREPWIRRWNACQRFTLPAEDDESASLFDSTAGDAVENLAASMYSLLTPPESLWLNLARDLSPGAARKTAELAEISENDAAEPADAELSDESTAHATLVLQDHLNDSNFYTTIHQCYLDLVILGTTCLFMSENPIGSESAFSFTAIPMRDIAVIRGAIFHTTTMPATEIAEKHPGWTPPANLQAAIKEKVQDKIRLK